MSLAEAGPGAKSPYGQDSEIVNLSRSLREILQLSQQKLGSLLQVSVRTVSRWESGTAAPDASVRMRLVRLKRIVEERLKLDPDVESAIIWLTTPRAIQCRPIDLLSIANESEHELRHLYDAAK